MMLTAIDVEPAVSLLIGVVLVLLAAWYWQRLGRDEVDRSTRAIRRGSLVLCVLAIFALVRAASFIDSEVNPRVYMIAWLSALGLIFLVVMVMAVDILNSFRLHRRALQEDALETAARLGAELEKLAKQDAVRPVNGEDSE